MFGMSAVKYYTGISIILNVSVTAMVMYYLTITFAGSINSSPNVAVLLHSH